MNVPTCQYQNTFGIACGGRASVQLMNTEPLASDDPFQVSCVEHRGALSRTWPNRFFMEFI